LSAERAADVGRIAAGSATGARLDDMDALPSACFATGRNATQYLEK
jgi:hypothetical protein